MSKLVSISRLEKAARKARSSAYAPYSGFQVGAALETDTGKLFAGCNVENLSFGLTICAERNAVFSAIASGYKNFKRIVIVADTVEPITPCGACRQVLAEFSDDMEIVSTNLVGKMFHSQLRELLPRPKAGILNNPCST